MSEIIQSLWIGSKLSNLEICSMTSFIKNGHTYHLYTYDTVENVPQGVQIKDGNEILDKSEIFTYENGSPSAFSNLFRYTLLYKKGGYWVDTDIICNHPFKFEQDYLFITEPDKDYINSVLTPSVLKAPAGNEYYKYAIKLCYKLKELVLNGKMKWGMGPKTIESLVNQYNLHKYKVKWDTFMTCYCFHFLSMVNPNYKPHPLMISKPNEIPEHMVGIHFWNECFRRYNLDKNDTFDKNSLYEYFKKKYNVR